MSSEDRPAGIRDLAVEVQDTIQDVTAFYLDSVQDDYLEEPHENEQAYLAAVELYYNLTGAWRDGGQDVYTKPYWLIPQSAH